MQALEVLLEEVEELEGTLLVGTGAIGIPGESAKVAEGLVGPEFELVEVRVGTSRSALMVDMLRGMA